MFLSSTNSVERFVDICTFDIEIKTGYVYGISPSSILWYSSNNIAGEQRLLVSNMDGYPSGKQQRHFDMKESLWNLNTDDAACDGEYRLP